MMATEFALNNIPVRVNSIAPGVYASEMTLDTIGPEEVEKVAQGLFPVPARRAGTQVAFLYAIFRVLLTRAYFSAGEVAGSVIYLSTAAGCYTNGQELVVDGGYVAVNPSTR